MKPVRRGHRIAHSAHKAHKPQHVSAYESSVLARGKAKTKPRGGPSSSKPSKVLGKSRIAQAHRSGREEVRVSHMSSSKGMQAVDSSPPQTRSDRTSSEAVLGPIRTANAESNRSNNNNKEEEEQEEEGNVDGILPAVPGASVTGPPGDAIKPVSASHNLAEEKASTSAQSAPTSAQQQSHSEVHPNSEATNPPSTQAAATHNQQAISPPNATVIGAHHRRGVPALAMAALSAAQDACGRRSDGDDDVSEDEPQVSRSTGHKHSQQHQRLSRRKTSKLGADRSGTALGEHARATNHHKSSERSAGDAATRERAKEGESDVEAARAVKDLREGIDRMRTQESFQIDLIASLERYRKHVDANTDGVESNGQQSLAHQMSRVYNVVGDLQTRLQHQVSKQVCSCMSMCLSAVLAQYNVIYRLKF
jgi:hypothetical protein